MTRLALATRAVILTAALLAPASAAEEMTAEQVADLAVSSMDCPRLHTASALWYTTVKIDGETDLRERRFVDLKGDRPFYLTRLVSNVYPRPRYGGVGIDKGVVVDCVPDDDEGTNDCAWKPFTLVPESWEPFLALKWYRLENRFMRPGHDGAEVFMRDGAEAVQGAKWHIGISPGQSIPSYDAYIAEDGMILAIDVMNERKKPVREYTMEMKVVDGCRVIAAYDEEVLGTGKRVPVKVIDHAFVDEIDPDTFVKVHAADWPKGD